MQGRAPGGGGGWWRGGRGAFVHASSISTHLKAGRVEAVLSGYNDGAAAQAACKRRGEALKHTVLCAREARAHMKRHVGR